VPPSTLRLTQGLAAAPLSWSGPSSPPEHGQLPALRRAGVARRQGAAPQPLDIKYEKVPFSKNLKDMVETDMAVCGNRLLVVSGGFDFAQVFNLPDLKPVGPAGVASEIGQRRTSESSHLLRRPTVATDGKSFLFSVWSGSPVALLNRVSTDCKVDEAPIFWAAGSLPSWVRRWPSTRELPARPAPLVGGEEGSYGVNSHLCARRVTPDGKPLGAADLDVPGRRRTSSTPCPPGLRRKGHVLMVWEQRRRRRTVTSSRRRG